MLCYLRNSMAFSAIYFHIPTLFSGCFPRGKKHAALSLVRWILLVSSLPAAALHSTISLQFLLWKRDLKRNAVQFGREEGQAGRGGKHTGSAGMNFPRI